MSRSKSNVCKWPRWLCVIIITYDFLKRGGPDGETTPLPTVGKKKCFVALDIGTDSSSLIITDGGKIIWQRPIPLGGNHFTRSLTKEMKLTFAKAEHLKRNAAKSPELANILKALKPVLTDFVGEVQRSLGYFTNTHRDAHIEAMIGLGSAFKLPGLQKYLGDKLQLKVEKPAKFVRVVGDAVTASPVFMENILTFPVAYGLALQGLGVARIGTNLLPPEISFDRQIRAKKPWAVAAAAALLLGTAVMAFGYSIPYAAVNNEAIGKALKDGDGVLKEAETVAGQIVALQKEVDATAKTVTQQITGLDERPNWVKINEYVNQAVPTLPSPKYFYLIDPRAFPPPPPDKQVKYRLDDYLSERVAPEWDMGNMMTNQRYDQKATVFSLWTSGDRDESGASPWLATQKYYERINKGVDPIKAAREDDMRQYLATLDIESIHCRYTPNLKGFFEAAKADVRKVVGTDYFEGMDEDEQKKISDGKLPEGKGWVFEIRGTSWYKFKRKDISLEAAELLKLTFLPNLKKLAKKDDKTPADDPIRGRVSHLFLFNTWRIDNPHQDKFESH